VLGSAPPAGVAAEALVVGGLGVLDGLVVATVKAGA